MCSHRHCQLILQQSRLVFIFVNAPLHLLIPRPVSLLKYSSNPSRVCNSNSQLGLLSQHGRLNYISLVYTCSEGRRDNQLRIEQAAFALGLSYWWLSCYCPLVVSFCLLGKLSSAGDHRELIWLKWSCVLLEVSLKAAIASISKLLIEVTLLHIKMYQKRWTKATGWLPVSHLSLSSQAL